MLPRPCHDRCGSAGERQRDDQPLAEPVEQVPLGPHGVRTPEPDDPGPDLDDERRVVPAEKDAVDAEEVRGQDQLSLGVQEPVEERQGHRREAWTLQALRAVLQPRTRC